MNQSPAERLGVASAARIILKYAVLLQGKGTKLSDIPNGMLHGAFWSARMV